MRSSWLAPFRVKSFRFQWPSDLLTSWAFEMEMLILGWYVLVETGSVLLLTAYAGLLYIGTLVAPMIGTIGDRIGHRTTLAIMRASYATLAATLTVLTVTKSLSPALVFAISAIAGLIRPSDLAMRNALIASTIPPDDLTSALGISRTTMDSARIMGAIAGAGVLASLGMAAAYVMVTALYLSGLLLTLGISRETARRPQVAEDQARAVPSQHTSIWRELKDGLRYCWSRPAVRAAMSLAVLVNLTAFPLSNGILPYVARDIYGTDQTGLGYLAASYATGALVGSLVISRSGPGTALGRLMLVTAGIWHLMLLGFGQMTSLTGGMCFLFLSGLAQSFSMLAMAVMILRTTEPAYRGRMMGVRMLAIYSQPFGLLGAGVLFGIIGFPATMTLYSVAGLAITVAIGLAWQRDIWHREAPANRGT